MAAAPATRDTGIDIRRLTLGLRLCGDAQRLDPVARRLERLARGRLATALAGVRLEHGLPGNSAGERELIFIERLAVECSGNTAWDDDRLLSHIARRLALSLEDQFTQPGVLRFRDRPDYIAAAVLAIAQGRLAQCWWFDEFDGLKTLAASVALRTLVINEAAHGTAALARLAPGALDQVLRLMSEGDASRLIAWLSAFDAGAPAPFESLWPSALQLQREGDAPLRWLQALVAAERTAPGSMGARSLRLVRDMVTLLRRAASGQVMAWQQARDRATREALLAAPDDSAASAWLHELTDGQFETVLAALQHLAQPRDPADAPSLMATRHGGFFLALARVHRLGWIARFQATLQQRRPEWLPAQRDALCRALACRIAATALAPLASDTVLRDPAIVAACALADVAIDEHPDLLMAALRSVLRTAAAAANTAPAADRTSTPSTKLPRLVAEAAMLVMADLGRALPGLAASTAAFLREQALSLAAVIEPAPAAQDSLPTVVRLGRASLDVLLVLSGVKRQQLLLPGIAPIQLREDYSA